MNKLCTLAEAISLVHDGDCVGLGGNTLNRAPMAAVFELIRQGRTAPAAGGAVSPSTERNFLRHWCSR